MIDGDEFACFFVPVRSPEDLAAATQGRLNFTIGCVAVPSPTSPAPRSPSMRNIATACLSSDCSSVQKSFRSGNKFEWLFMYTACGLPCLLSCNARTHLSPGDYSHPTNSVVRGLDIATTSVKKLDVNRVVREFAIEISEAFQRTTTASRADARSAAAVAADQRHARGY